MENPKLKPYLNQDDKLVLEEALSAEEYFYQLKFNQEALLSLYDTAKQDIDIDILKEYLKKNPDTTFGRKLKEILTAAYQELKAKETGFHEMLSESRTKEKTRQRRKKAGLEIRTKELVSQYPEIDEDKFWEILDYFNTRNLKEKELESKTQAKGGNLKFEIFDRLYTELSADKKAKNLKLALQSKLYNSLKESGSAFSGLKADQLQIVCGELVNAFKTERNDFTAKIKQLKQEYSLDIPRNEATNIYDQLVSEKTAIEPKITAEAEKESEELNTEMATILIQGIKQQEKANFGNHIYDYDLKDQRDIKKMIDNRVVGRLIKYEYLITMRYEQLKNTINKLTTEHRQEIDSYREAVLPKTKAAIKSQRQTGKGIKLIAEQKVAHELTESKEHTARLYGTSVNKLNILQKAMAAAIKKELNIEITFDLKNLTETTEQNVSLDFIYAYSKYFKELKNLHAMLHTGQVVETKSVKRVINRAMPTLTKNPPGVVYFHGNYGTGKTAIAIHISKTRFKKEPIIVAGNQYLEPSDLTEEFKVKMLSLKEQYQKIAGQLKISPRDIDKLNIDEIISEILNNKKELKNKIISNHYRENFLAEKIRANQEYIFNQEEFDKYLSSINQKDLPKDYLKDIDQSLDSIFDNKVQGQHILQGIYLAMLKGVPLIIDEANTIPPEVLIAFNDAMTKKIGSKIKVKADLGEYFVKNGYCIMWTGNTGEKYRLARFNDIDPAGYSRITPIEVNYLPQSRRTLSQAQDFKRLTIADTVANDADIYTNPETLKEFIRQTTEFAKNDEIFQILLTKILNQRLGAWIMVKKDDQYSFIKDLYRLSTAARIIMDVFENETDNMPPMPGLEKLIGSAEPSNIAQKLVNSNLTMRELIDSIIGNNLAENNRLDLEYYIFQFVQKLDLTNEERAILYAILQTTGFFSTAENWPNYADPSCRNINDFNKLIEKDPGSYVSKYRQLENSEVVSLLKTFDQNGNQLYEFRYLNSMEAVQLMFGFLPPTAIEEYQNVLQKISQKRQEQLTQLEIESQLEEALKIRANFNHLIRNQICSKESIINSSDIIAEISQKLYNSNLSKQELSNEEYFEEVKMFCDYLSELLRTEGHITSEQAQEISGLPLNEKIEAIQKLITKK